MEQIKNKKTFTICGFSIYRIFAYFIIYSIVGYIIETIFGIISKGVWESRQSFLYGPFCAIYGVGAVIMLLCLHNVKRSHNALFIGGFIVGSVVEYAVSFLGEALLNVKWWDYSGMPFNINGRICVLYSIFWGFLAIYLVLSFNPKVDKMINWLKTKVNIRVGKIAIIVTIIILLLDCIATAFALHFFKVRMIVEHNIDVSNRQVIEEQYHQIYDNEELSKFIHTFWNDKKMIRTFPNLKSVGKDGEIIYFGAYLPDIQPYYVKIYDKKKSSEIE